jgi:hypothetical protein
MIEYQRVNDIYTNWMTSGIFSDLNKYDVPWKDKNITHDLDIAYHGVRSGDKIVSVLVDRLLNDDGTISQENRDKIAEALYSVYGSNWTHLWNTTIQEYNLMDNTDAYITETTETEQNTDTNNNGTDSGTVTHSTTGTDTTTGTGTITHGISGDDTTTNTGTITTGGTSTENTTDSNSVYGFDSGTGSNSDSQSHNGSTDVNQTETRNTTDKVTHNTTDTETRDTTDTLTHNTTDKETRDLKTRESGSEKVTGTITHETHRHGNIGVTTNQQMLEEERKLWTWNFYNQVFEDVDKFLTINIY